MRQLAAVILLALTSVFVLQARVIRRVNYTCTPQGVIRIDSIDYRKTLTRVYCHVIGRPHTSMRFDKISGCTDIDGVDFHRWFQFEDNGNIALELDFNPFHNQTFNFVITTPQKNITIIVNK